MSAATLVHILYIICCSAHIFWQQHLLPSSIFILSPRPITSLLFVDTVIRFSFLLLIKPLLAQDWGLLPLSLASSRVHPMLIFSTVLLTLSHPGLLPSITELLDCHLLYDSSFFFLHFFWLSACPWKLSSDLWTPVPPGIRPVTHLYLSEVTSDSVSVAWNAPAPPADLFILSYSSADGTDTSKMTLDGSKIRSLVQGLLPCTQYTVSLITIQGDVTSEPITTSLTTGEPPVSWKFIRTWMRNDKYNDQNHWDTFV